MPHRRIVADGFVIAVRIGDGTWQVGDQCLLDAKITREDGSEVDLTLRESWDGRGAIEDRTPTVQLYGSGLSRDEAATLAIADDESRCWIDERSGRAFDLALAL